MDDAIGLQPTLFERLFVLPAPALRARWIFLRALGGIFLSAFLSLAWTIRGLVGADGISPARDLLDDLAARWDLPTRLWRVPTLLWIDASDGALTALVAVGMVASVLLIVNVAPRASIAVAGVAFLSFVSAAQQFSMYQSDGMLLEAAFVSLFFAPRGLRPGLGEESPPSGAALFMLRWEWFRIYFESGVVKIASQDEQWATLTAMDHYYENGPLPTWIGWYAQHLPHPFHAATVILTFVVELGVVWLAWMGRRARAVCFAIVTPFQIGIILTANYAFLNYIVLSLGVLLLDDGHLARLRFAVRAVRPRERRRWRAWGAAVALGWAFYATVLDGLHVPLDGVLALPALALEPARIANAYGLFAVMTRDRFELEFQASADGVRWLPYRFRYKPQALDEPPGIYAPYQPRFDWNLWFASLDSDVETWVIDAALRLMQRSPGVLALFREDPLRGAFPAEVRVVKWRYRFTSLDERRRTGAWWTRELAGPYGPTLTRDADGTVRAAPSSRAP